MNIPARSRSHLLINFIAFEIGWFAVVLGAAHDYVWTGILVAALVVLLHLLMSHHLMHQLKLLISVVLIGTAWDSTLAASNVIHYPTGQLLSSMAPVWIMAVWALFATTLNVSLVFLRQRWWLAALFGAIGAPLSFLGGMRLQALQFPETGTALLALAIGWAVLMPLLMYLSIRFDGVNVTSEQSVSASVGVQP